MELKMSITDTDIFEELIKVFKEFAEDKEIPQEVKNKYKEKILNLVTK